MEKLFPAVLSFLLPGLGQLFKKDFVRAVLFFGVFLGVQLSLQFRIYLPIVVVLASAEAFFSKGQIQEQGKRNTLYATAGLIGLVSWSFSYFPMVHSVGYQMELNERVPELVRAIRECQKREGHLAIDFEKCVTPALNTDPWGNKFGFSLLTEGGFEIRSAGSDKAMNTNDDFAFRFK